VSGMERFTQRARRVLSLAHQEAERMRHSYIGTEHLLLGLIREEGARPALVIGMPVGFVSAAESKAALAAIANVPWIVTDGRKGGSTLAVAALHALLALAEARQKT